MHKIITLDDYFGPYKDHPGAQAALIVEHATKLLSLANEFLTLADEDGVELEINPLDGNEISGEGNGGFRPQDCPVGAPLSAHKDARGIDHTDRKRALVRWALTDGLEHAERLGLYFEHPQWTRSWLHMQWGAPHSGNRFFVPYSDIIANPPTCAALPEFKDSRASLSTFAFKGGK